MFCVPLIVQPQTLGQLSSVEQMEEDREEDDDKPEEFNLRTYVYDHVPYTICVSVCVCACVYSTVLYGTVYNIHFLDGTAMWGLITVCR